MAEDTGGAELTATELGEDDLWALSTHFRRGTPDSREQRLHDRVQLMQERGHKVPRRGRSLSRPEIVAAAITVADAEGPEAISMRRIARELNAGAMSLYWHVASKDELLDLMLDAVEGEVEFPPPTGDWRVDMRGMALAQRRTLHRHQWLTQFIGARPPLGPNSLLHLEQALDVIGQLGLETRTALDVLTTMMTYVLGAVLREFRERSLDRTDEEALAGFTPAERQAILAANVARVRASGRFPHFLRLFDENIDPDAAETRDARFEFGLDCVLDGIAARLPGLAGRNGKTGAPG